jgi:hypothetical protein
MRGAPDKPFDWTPGPGDPMCESGPRKDNLESGIWNP